MCKTRHRILSLAMALMMIFTLLPTTAFAAEPETIQVTIYTKTNGSAAGTSEVLAEDQMKANTHTLKVKTAYYTTDPQVLFKLDHDSDKWSDKWKVDNDDSDDGIFRLVAFKEGTPKSEVEKVLKGLDTRGKLDIESDDKDLYDKDKDGKKDGKLTKDTVFYQESDDYRENDGEWEWVNSKDGWKNNQALFGDVTFSDDGKIKQNKDSSLTINVVLDGNTTTGADVAKYITVTPSASTRNGSFSNGTLSYKYETYDCADFSVAAKTGYVIKGVSGTLVYGQSGSKSITASSGTISVDNAKGGSTVTVYVYTKYTVEYYKDDTRLTADNYRDSKAYVNDKVSLKVETPNLKESDKDGKKFTYVASDLNTSITLPALPAPSNASKQVDGWYKTATEEAGESKYSGPVEVSAHFPSDGTAIKFYAREDNVPAPNISVRKELTSVKRDDTTYTAAEKNLPTTLYTGDVLTWTITVSNSGKAAATGLSLTDTLKRNEDVITPGATITPTDSTVNKSNFGVEVDSSQTFTATYTVQSDDVGKTLSNTATATASDSTTHTSVPTPGVKVANPNVSVVKTADKEKAKLDDTITYTVKVTNTGNVTLTDLYLFDTKWSYPTQAIRVNGESGTAQNSSYKIAKLDPKQVVEIEYSYVVTANDVAYGKVENSATVNGGDLLNSVTGSKTVDVEEPLKQIIVNFGPLWEDGSWTDSTESKYAKTFTLWSNTPTDANNAPDAVSADSTKDFTGWTSNVGGISLAAGDEFSFNSLKDAVTFGTPDSKGIETGYIVFSPVFTPKATAKERYANVYFNVDPNKGFFPDYKPSTTVTFKNIPEFSDDQFQIPAVEAKEGYKFVGWKVEGAETGNWDANAKTFGITGLAHFPEGSNVGNCTVTAQFEEIEPVGPDAGKTLKIFWAIDNPAGAEWTTHRNSGVWTETIAWSDKDNTFVIPGLEVKEGYKLAGWSVSGKEANYWKAGTKTFGLTGLIVEGENGGSVAITANIVKDETPEDNNGSGGGGTTHTYTLKYETNGGKKIDSESKRSKWTKDYENLPVPTRSGYAFTGWYSDKKLTKLITDDVEVNISVVTIYAGWRKSSVPAMLNGDDHFAYIQGYADGTVHPDNNITRAQVATIFFRLLDEDVRDDSLTTYNTFTDVSADYWANTAISTMSELGVIQGYSDGTFRPNAFITRAQFAAICARFDDTVKRGSSDFTDIDGHWAKAEIERAATLGWIQGYSDGTFRPNNNITRAQAMTMINRVLCRLPEDEDDLLRGMNTWTDCNPGDWCYLAVQEATNSHDFQHMGVYESWTDLNRDPDWSKYEN